MEYVSLVIISHSEEIASGLRELLRQVHKNVKIAVAGGFEGGIGTDPLKIKAAIESVYSEEGVAIFFDLGSAFMNAEVAIELLDGQANVKIADAPLIEGAYAAAVAAGLRKSLDEVIEAAEKARGAAKIYR